MASSRDSKHQVHWWLDQELLAVLKDYQHDQRLDTTTEAADRLLRAALTSAGYSIPS